MINEMPPGDTNSSPQAMENIEYKIAPYSLHKALLIYGSTIGLWSKVVPYVGNRV